jgi:hypothetical protein
MKTIILAALLAGASFEASADEITKESRCSIISIIYQNAATARNLGRPPEIALDMASSFKEIPISERKAIINRVYFEQSFAMAGGDALRWQMLDLCLYGPNNFKPLK